MKKKAMREWMAANVDRKMREFGVSDWRVDVYYDADLGKLEDGQVVGMTCQATYERQRAAICVNYRGYDDFAEVEKAFEHELAHIAHAAFEPMWYVVQNALSPEAFRLFRRQWEAAQEATVRSVERIVGGIRAAERKKK